MNRILSFKDIEVIQQTLIPRLERVTSGEIKVVEVDRCDEYREIDVGVTLIGGIAGAMIMLWAYPDMSPWHMLLYFFIAGISSMALIRILRLRRLLVGLFAKGRMEREIFERAVQAFVQHNVHRTRDGTGIIILLADFERKACIFADGGINEKLPPDALDKCVRNLTKKIGEGEAMRGMKDSFEMLGEHLSMHFPRKDDDVNEIGDNVVVE